MAEPIAGVRFDLTADSAQFEAKLGQANRALRGAAAAGEQAGRQISAAMVRVGAAVAGAFAVDNLARFASQAITSAAAIGRFADQAGLTVREFEGLEHALRGAMMPTEQLAQAFAIFARNMSDLQRGTGSALDFIRRFAPALEEQFRAARSTSEQFLVLVDAVNGLSDAQDRVRLTQAMLGEQGARLINSMKQTSSVIQDQINAHQGLGERGVREAQRIEAAYNQLQRTLVNVAQTAAVAITGDQGAQLNLVERFLRAIGQSGTADVVRFANAMRQLREELQALGPAIASGPIKISPGSAEEWRLTADRIRAVQGELGLLQAQLTTLPPQTEFISQSFLAAWEKMRQQMLLNNATENELTAARLNLLRQEDAERMRILGSQMTFEDTLARRQAELHQARTQQLITESQLLRGLAAANASYVGAMAGAVGQGLQALASAWPKNKAFAIAMTTASTIQAVMRAWAEVPYPLNIGVAAMIGAAGIKNIASLQSLQPGGSATPAVGGGAGGATAAPVATPQPQQAITIDLHGGMYTREEVRALLERINELTRDGGTLIATALH